VPLALGFALFYPGWATLQLKRQSAWGGGALLWGGWAETLAAAGDGCAQYWAASSSGAADVLRGLRVGAFAAVYEVHVFSAGGGALLGLVGGAALAAALLALAAVKALPVLFRAYANHFAGAALWCRSAPMALVWVAALLLQPLVAVALFPGALAVAAWAGARAAASRAAAAVSVHPPHSSAPPPHADCRLSCSVAQPG